MRGKKLFALVLCILVIAMFSACGGDGSGGGDGEEGNTGLVKITYSFWGTPDEAKEVTASADMFNSSQDKIKVEVISIPHDTYVQKLDTLATAGELPDTGIMNEAGVLSLAKQGLLSDVSDMYEGAPSKPLDSVTFKDGDSPVAYSAANEVLILYYNKKMFDDANLDYPPDSADKAWTWDQFVEVAKKLTLDKKGNTPADAGFDENNIVQYGCMVENLTWQLEVWAKSNGGGFFSPDGNTVTMSDAAAVDAIQKVADLYLKHKVAPLSEGLTDDGLQRSIIAGNVAMATGGTWNVGTCLASAVSDDGLDYGVAVLPSMGQAVTICTGGPNVVYSQTKHPEEAMEWLKWYAQEQNNWGLISSGIWMPVLEEWYTDESKTREWVDNPNFPPYEQYKTAVVDYAMNNAQSTCWYFVNNTNDIYDLLSSVLGPVWTGDKTAKEAIEGSMDNLQKALDGN